MNFEVLKKSHLKRNIIIGVIVVAIISTVILNFTRAKYRVTESIPLVNGTINYKPYDFKIIAMYQENDNDQYIEINTMPSTGYVINEELSYCTLDGTNKDENVILKTIDGYHTFSNLQKGSKCYLYFDENSLTNNILADKEFQYRTFPTSLNSLIEGDNNYYYEAEDNWGVSYYFAGNPSDNWVYFANFWWRIIRINGDGSIRLIYQGTSPNETGEGTYITTSAYNNLQTRSEYVGYTYIVGIQRPENSDATDSNIKQILDSWYELNLLAHADKISEESGFCNDRNIVSGNWQSTSSETMFYAPSNRLSTDGMINPTLICDELDLYTTTNSTKGNHFLQYPIGLITADEASFAGIPASGNLVKNEDNFLTVGSIYWTMTPLKLIPNYASNQQAAYNFFIGSSGQLGDSSVYGNVTREAAVRPVINLKSDIILTGSGTIDDPYVVS